MTATVATVVAAARAVPTSTAATPTAAAAAAAAIFPGNCRHEVWEASRFGASQAARLPGNASKIKKIHLLMYSTIKVRNGIQATQQGRRHSRAGVGFELAIKRQPARRLDQ
jgi:hypothetical protein